LEEAEETVTGMHAARAPTPVAMAGSPPGSPRKATTPCCASGGGGGGRGGASADAAKAAATAASSSSNADAQRAAVAADYAKVATADGGCCVSSAPNRGAIGYTREDLALAGDADLGVGCGAPARLAALRPGEAVLDLGCGAGIDCFLAANDVGGRGVVIGVDMTPDMLQRAREGAKARGLAPPRVQFRLGEIENLPCADDEVDVVIRCVLYTGPHTTPSAW